MSILEDTISATKEAKMSHCDADIQYIDADWVRVKNECRTTVNKKATDNVPGQKFKESLLISEHSPIRLIRVLWRWRAIPYWVAMHFARHWLGWDKWIGTQRSDRTGESRDDKGQSALVPMDVCANAQSLINVSRFRLCYQSSEETRKHMEDVKEQIFRKGERELSDVMVPNCVYRSGCPEFHSCKVWSELRKNNPDMDLGDIRSRYRAYNKMFWAARGERVTEDEMYGQVLITGWEERSR